MSVGTGTTVLPDDYVIVDERPIKLRFVRCGSYNNLILQRFGGI